MVETDFAVTPHNGAVWIGWDPRTGEPVLVRLQPGRYTQDQIDDLIKREQAKLRAPLNLSWAPHDPGDGQGTE